MIKKLIEDEKYQEALNLLKEFNDEESNFLKLTCLNALGKNKEVIELSQMILENAEKYYYDILSIYLSSLLVLEEEEVALKILEEELSMPYIPYQYESKFNEVYDFIIRKRNSQSNNKSPYELLNDEELQEAILTTDDLSILIPVLSQLTSRNIRKHLLLLRNFLKDAKRPKIAKVIILEALCEQGVGEDFLLNDEGVLTEIIPTEITCILEDPILEKMEFYYEKFCFDKEIQFNEYSKEILITYLTKIYPLTAEEEEHALIIAATYAYVKTMQNEEISFQDLCEKFLLKETHLEAMYESISKCSSIY